MFVHLLYVKMEEIVLPSLQTPTYVFAPWDTLEITVKQVSSFCRFHCSLFL